MQRSPDISRWKHNAMQVKKKVLFQLKTNVILGAIQKWRHQGRGGGIQN